MNPSRAVLLAVVVFAIVLSASVAIATLRVPFERAILVAVLCVGPASGLALLLLRRPQRD